MLKKCDRVAQTDASVKVIICFTDGLNFDELKTRLPVGDDDAKTASRFADEKDKVSHLISAYFKRKYVGEWAVNALGKPQGLRAFFNVSHCSGAVVIALSDAEVGVDAENVRPVARSLVEYVSDEKELPFVNSDEDFFRLWTAKESLAKAQGEGLKKDIKKIPAFPFDGEKEYAGESYFSRQLKDGAFIITVVRKGKTPFIVDIDSDNLI